MKRVLRVFLPVLLAAATIAQDLPSSTIEGIVLDAATGQPVAGVTVTRSGPPLPPLPPPEVLPDGTTLPVMIPRGNLQPPPPRAQMVTGPDGRFSLSNLDSGQIAILFQRGGYVFRSVPYTLSPGQEVRDAVIRIIPFGIISGRLVDPNGNPAVEVSVEPFRQRVGSGSQVAYYPGTRTNDRGEFRLIDLTPGAYWISFSKSSTPSLNTPAQGAYGPLLYPGVRAVDAGERVDLVPGVELRLKDIVLAPAPPDAIRVRLINPPGESAKNLDFAFSNESPSIGVPDSSGAYQVASGVTASVNNAGNPGGRNPDGSLRFPQLHLEPGTDLVRTYWATAPATYRARASWQEADGSQRNVTALIHFSGRDVSADITTAKPGGRLTGRVLFQKDPGAPAIPLAGVTISATNTVSALSFTRTSTPDGTFHIADLAEGRYDFSSFRNLPPDSYIAGARQGDRDVLRDGIVVSKDSPDLEVVLRTGVGALRGRVTDPQGRPVHDAVVALLPEPPLNSSNLSFLSRTGNSDQLGDFQLHQISPGTYRLYSWSRLGANSVYDPAFIKGFEERGIPVRVEENQRLSVDLRILD